MKHFLSCACSLLLFGFAQAALAEAGSAPGATTTLDQKGKTVLMADDATGAAQLQGFNPAPKRIWMSGWQKSSQTLSWKVKAPAEADYEVELISSGIPAVRLEGGSAPLEAKLAPQGWQRQTLGRIHLKNGDNTLTLSLPQDLPSGGQLRSLDLLPVAARADYDQRVKASRSSAAWMRGHYGVFLQYGAWGWPEHGDKKPWEEVVKAFDVEKFAKMVDEDMGAKWVIWSITWRGSIFPMPLKSVDAIVPGHTTQRDLPADLIAALKKRGIKLMFYYHPGSEDPTWWAANWKDGHDKEKFISNWQAVMTEIGSRYGEDLAGWFFDDGCVYSPAPFEAMTRTAKTGFPGRLVSYNNWVLPSYTDFEDIQMGEGFTGSKATALGSDGVYKDGQHPGQQAHGMFSITQPDWGIWNRDTKTTLTMNSAQALGILRQAIPRGQAMSLNFNMYEDGSVTPETLDLFRQVKQSMSAVPTPTVKP